MYLKDECAHTPPLSPQPLPCLCLSLLCEDIVRREQCINHSLLPKAWGENEIFTFSLLRVKLLQPEGYMKNGERG